jgi:hypothetical protein
MKDKLILIGAILLAITMLYLGRHELRIASILHPNPVYAQGMIGAYAGRAVGNLTGNTTTVDFSTVTNPTTATAIVTFTANTVKMYFTTIAIGGTNSAEYSFVTWNCPTTGLAAASTCTAQLEFMPNTTTGAKSGSASISYSW